MVTTAAITAAFLSTGFISLAPNIVLMLCPRYAAGEGNASTFLQMGQSLAAGGLLGDVFLHTLPHIAAEGDDMFGIWVLLGFTIFYFTDCVIRTVQNHHHHDAHKEANGDIDQHERSNQSTIFLNLAADAAHNFTDGMAIGASYASSLETSVGPLLASRGGLATLSILFHEVPHEIGDFCTLVGAGYSFRQALLAQFSTAIAAFFGTVFALYVSEIVGDRLLLVTAGGFVYLAATTILPDVLKEQNSFSYRILQLLSFMAGIGFMYTVAWLEKQDETHHDTHHIHKQPIKESRHHHGEL